MPKEEKPVEKKEEKKLKYMIGEVATQTDLVIVDTETNENYTTLTFLAKIGNDIEELKKLL